MSQAQLTHSPGGGGIASASATGMLGEREVVRNTGKKAIVSFLESQTVYSVLRASGKVVVFDTRIPIQLAFYALVEHGKIYFVCALNYLALVCGGNWVSLMFWVGGGGA